MDLTRNVIKQFVSVTTPPKTTSNDVTVYGTIAGEGDKLYVKIDGSDVLTPITSSVDVRDGDRVLVLIKNHEAMVIGAPYAPSARLEELKKLEGDVTEFGVIIADKVGTEELIAIRAEIGELQAKDVTITGRLDVNEANVQNLTAENATINGKLTAYQADIEDIKTKKLDAEYAEIEYAKIKELEVVDASIKDLEADHGEFKELTAGKFSAVEANIENLNVEKLSVKEAEIEYAKIKELEVIDASIKDLEADHGEFKELTAGKFSAIDADIAELDTKKLSADEAEIKYANIDFANIGEAAIKKIFSDSGLIKDLIVGDGTITGELIGVTIKGDLIEGNTVKADKLVVKGSDGLYYKLNFEAGTFAGGEEVPDDSLHGSVITANSITAEKINVHDLVAFDATIGGFKITDNAIHSVVKESVDNTTQGVYLGNDGQVAIGDQDNYIKFYKDQNGQYQLDISVVNRIKQDIDDMEIGGRNLIRNSTTLIFDDYSFIERGPLGTTLLGRTILRKE